VPTITIIEHDGQVHTLDVSEGTTVMEAAIQYDIPGIIGECGGSCSCATCHCYVDPRWMEKLEARSELESEMLEFAACATHENSRLSCQLEVTAELDGMVVRLPEAQL